VLGFASGVPSKTVGAEPLNRRQLRRPTQMVPEDRMMISWRKVAKQRQPVRIGEAQQ
jgi:hypothetical protein